MSFVTTIEDILATQCKDAASNSNTTWDCKMNTPCVALVKKIVLLYVSMYAFSTILNVTHIIPAKQSYKYRVISKMAKGRNKEVWLRGWVTTLKTATILPSRRIKSR